MLKWETKGYVLKALQLRAHERRCSAPGMLNHLRLMIMKSCVACIFILLNLEEQVAWECKNYDKELGKSVAVKNKGYMIEH